MTAHIISVSQLRSYREGVARLYIHDDMYSGIGVRGHMDNPTYLLTKGHSFELIQFEDRDSADAWLKENVGEYKIRKLEPEQE